MMTKSILLSTLMIFTFLLTANAQEKNEDTPELEWLSWNEGYPKAKESGKILLIDLYTDWCGWCKKMDKDTYAKPEIIEMINKHFVPVKLNPEKTNITYDVEGNKYSGRQMYALLVQKQRVGYPTTIFLFANEKKVYLQPGYQNAERFKATLNTYIDLKSGN